MTVLINDLRQARADKLKEKVQDVGNYVELCLSRLPKTAEEIADVLAESGTRGGKRDSDNPIVQWADNLPLFGGNYSFTTRKGKHLSSDFGSDWRLQVTLPEAVVDFLERFMADEFPGLSW